jgi:hypothetical protein
MGEVRVRSSDRKTLVAAEDITALSVRGNVLEAEVVSMGVVVLAEGSPEELADAVHALMPGIDRLGEGAHTVEAVRERAGGIGWVAVADDESGGAGWAAASAARIDKATWPLP